MRVCIFGVIDKSGAGLSETRYGEEKGKHGLETRRTVGWFLVGRELSHKNS